MREIDRLSRHARKRSVLALDPVVLRYVIFCALVAVTFLCGGGARADIQSLVVLRPAVVLCGALALAMTPPNAERPRAPFWLLCALAGVMIAQLIPLPYSIWSTLPGRALIAGNDRVFELGAVSRPLSLSPNRTMNSLLSLSVPICAFLAVRSQPGLQPRRLLWPVLAAAGLSALFGLFQVLGQHGNSLYFYRITNTDAAVGLFSNRNHHAIFLASVLPLIGYVGLSARRQERARVLVQAACASGALFIITLILATGSRAGAILMVAALLATSLLWVAQVVFERRKRPRASDARWQRVVFLGSAVLIISVSALTFVATRSLAFQRLFSAPLDDELRVRLLPFLSNMAWSYFPAGTGFGAFELVYKTVEPVEFLDLQYLNQAHNDLVQLVIEGGLAGVVLLALFGIWFVLTGWRSARRLVTSLAADRSIEVAPFAWISLAIVLAGGLGDYPLRTPSIMLYAAILCTLLPNAVVARAWRSRGSQQGRVESPGRP